MTLTLCKFAPSMMVKRASYTYETKHIISLYLQMPFCVVVGWFIGRPMDLDFELFETATLFMTVLVVSFMLQVCDLSNTQLISALWSEKKLFRHMKTAKFELHSLMDYVWLFVKYLAYSRIPLFNTYNLIWRKEYLKSHIDYLCNWSWL